MKKCQAIPSFCTGVSKMKIIWCMVPDKWSVPDNFLSFWAILYPFTLLTIQEITILKKMKKTLEDIKLKLCTTNDDHMIYGSWVVESNIHNFLLFWAIFCPFTPLTTWKIKILKKKTIFHHFTLVYHKWKSYDVCFLRCGKQQAWFFVNLDHNLPFHSLITWKIKILRKWIKRLEILLFYTCAP